MSISGQSTNSQFTSAQRAERDLITADCIRKALSTVREFLGLDIAFITEFGTSERTIRCVDMVGEHPSIREGATMPLDVGYCLDIVEGRMPELVPDTSLVQAAAEKPETAALRIGSHVGVSIPLDDGGIYGTLCCFGTKAAAGLGQRDLQVVRAVADLIGSQLDTLLEPHRSNDRRRCVIEKALSGGLPEIAYQPVYDIVTSRVVAAEALSRFPVEPMRSPDKWFADAAGVGMETVLTEAAIKRSLQNFRTGFEAGLVLGLNVSPALACEMDLVRLFSGFPYEQITLEITEHDIVEDYEALEVALRPCRKLGVKISIDDMGAGYANIRHVLQMRPDCVKVDVSIIRDIDQDPMKQAWLAGIMEFARRAGCDVLGEGVETDAELQVLKELGVQFGQGYLLGMPMPVAALVASTATH